MSRISAKSAARADISVVVTRADGSVDNFGVIASNSPWFRLVGRHIARLRTYYLNRRH